MNESKNIEAMPTMFVTEKAPRTAITLNSTGTLSLVQVMNEYISLLSLR